MGRQHGVVLIEALVAILIFSLGILGLVALGGQAVGAQSDAQYRTEASGVADAIAGEVAVGVDRTLNGDNIKASLDAFRHQEDPSPDCVFTGGATADPEVVPLLARAATLPGASNAQQRITVQNVAGSFNRVEVTICWRTANDNGAWRKHTYVTYINGGRAD